MKPHTQAVREANAWNRILLAIKERATAEGKDVSVFDVTHRNPNLQELFQKEAVADYLDPEGAAPPPAEATPTAQPAKVAAKTAKATAAQPAEG
jgi:hypothetical protein